MYEMAGDNCPTTRTILLMYGLAGDSTNKYFNYADPRLHRKPNNRELASLCQLICKIIHVSRERLVPYYRVFSVLYRGQIL